MTQLPFSLLPDPRFFEKTKITIKFEGGHKRTYMLFEDGKNSLASGGTAILKFKHPKFGEFMEASIEATK